jgi:hypothetical protein
MTARHAQLQSAGSATEIGAALASWRVAVEDLGATTPGTTDRRRAQLIETARRLVYQELARDVGHDQ